MVKLFTHKKKYFFSTVLISLAPPPPLLMSRVNTGWTLSRRFISISGLLLLKNSMLLNMRFF